MDWKKEIKLADLVGRKRATESTQAVAEKPVPFWKKELSFRRKPKVEAPELRPVADEDWVREQLALAAAAAAAPAPPSPAESIHPPVPASELPPLPKEKKHSLLKKELSFRPKPRSEKPPKETKPKQSLLQKEISFGGRRKAEQPKEKTPKQSPLKREISFRRKPKEAPPARSRGDKQAPGARRAPKRVVGLKIGASQLAAARVANNGRTELVKVVREPLEPGVVVAGELRDPEALAVALKAFFRKHRLPRRGVRLGIASNRIGVRTLDVVGISDPKQLANAIRFRAQEVLPIPIDEAVLDYRILSESETEEGERICRVLLVVAYRELVDRYVAACRKAGIWLVGIDLEAFALLRSLAPPRSDDAEAPEAALVAVAIGHDRSTFAVSDGRFCEFTRVLEWGGATLDGAVAHALDLSAPEAEPIKRSLSLADGPAPEGLTEEQATAAREAMRRQVQTFARELVSSLQFYQGQPGSLGIGEIVLTGGTAHLDGLADDLERLIGVRVRPGDPLVRVKVGKRVRDPEPIGSLAVAIGLGIED
jgi:type IV pilus assembly protein PilM